ncbi:MAG: YqaJ viral recombinase family protein, partial [Bacteroidales bacterium]|nr:YqaJ viral recombinase family protein [Bacteroidales bacterium]
MKELMFMIRMQKIPIRDLSREAWLELRRHSIGGSDAAGIVGLSKWASPYSIWAEKTGRMPEQPDNEAMRQGRDLEDYVVQRWREETGLVCRRENKVIYNPQYPWAHANVDRLVVGVRAGLECKTTSTLNLRTFIDVEFPEQYYVQCVHYLAVTGLDRWHLAVLVFGRGFYCYTLDRNQAEIDALMDAEEAFWHLVEMDTPPSMDGTDATTSTLKTLYSVSRSGSVDLFGREALLQEYCRLRNQQKELGTRMAEIENTIKADLGEADSGICDAYRVSWKTQVRKTFQTKAFAVDHPDLD